jgi:hypothetical protein
VSDAPQNTAGPIRRFVGLALIVVGVLWIGASGLCSAAFFVGMLIEGSNADIREILSIIPMIALVGGFSAGIGFVLFVIGRALRPRSDG